MAAPSPPPLAASSLDAERKMLEEASTLHGPLIKLQQELGRFDAANRGDAAPRRARASSGPARLE
jgi:hypothetical protein